MDEDRIRRYWDKINLISKRSDEIREWIDISPEDFAKDEKTKLATYKAFQEIVEACMDIIAMMCKDLKIPPKDDYTNIELLGNKIPFDNTEKTLIEANGLRNRLVHGRNSTDDLRAFESIREILPGILNVVKGIKKWTKDIEQIRKDLEFLSEKVLAVVIYGSRVTGENTERSDIDELLIALLFLKKCECIPEFFYNSFLHKFTLFVKHFSSFINGANKINAKFFPEPSF